MSLKKGKIVGWRVQQRGGSLLEVQVPSLQQWWELLINSSFSMKQKEWFIKLAGGGQKRLLGDSEVWGENMNSPWESGEGLQKESMAREAFWATWNDQSWILSETRWWYRKSLDLVTAKQSRISTLKNNEKLCNILNNWRNKIYLPSFKPFTMYVNLSHSCQISELFN